MPSSKWTGATSGSSSSASPSRSRRSRRRAQPCRTRAGPPIWSAASGGGMRGRDESAERRGRRWRPSRMAMTAPRGTGRAPDPGCGWTIVTVLAVTETVSWGVLYYAFAVFLPTMQRALGWSKTELTGAFSLALATSALAAFPVGRWLDRHSPRPLMTLGSLAGALLVLAWSQVHELLLFYLVWAGIGLAMACVLYEAAFTVVTEWFRERRRQALTAVTLVGGWASFVFSPLSNWLIHAQGWRDALITLAIILAATTVPLHAVFLRRGPEAADRALPPVLVADAVASNAFWYLTAAF